MSESGGRSPSAGAGEDDLRSLLDRRAAPSLAARKEKLRGLLNEITRRESDLLQALEADLGKPPLEAFVSEIHFLATEIRHALARLDAWAKPGRAPTPFYFWPARSEIRREPYGKALILAPWNYPLLLSLSPAVSAVAAGNRVVLKPSELAAASAGLLAEIVEAVFEPDHVRVIEGGGDTAARLLQMEFDFIFFTGSERVGRLVARAAAERLTPMALELGGKCPCIVDTDVDLEMAAGRIAAGKFFNAGQTCFAPDFAVVPEALKAPFVEAVVAWLRRTHGEEKNPDLAGIVNARHMERLRRLATGDAVQVGRDGDTENELRFAPRVLTGVGWDHPSMQEEIFGPVLPVVGYRDFDDVMRRLKAMPSPLALYIFSRDRAFQEDVISALRSGSVCINDTMKQAQNLHLPFGGVGASGFGRYRGRAGFEQFTYGRTVTRRFFCPDPFKVEPPYAGRLERLKKILR